MDYVILWFTCKKVIDAHLKNGYHLIGGLKTNRIIYPQGIRTSIKNFATCIGKNDVRLVTVNHQSYLVYRYDGALNEIDNAVVVFCWPKDALLNTKAMRTHHLPRRLDFITFINTLIFLPIM